MTMDNKNNFLVLDSSEIESEDSEEFNILLAAKLSELTSKGWRLVSVEGIKYFFERDKVNLDTVPSVLIKVLSEYNEIIYFGSHFCVPNNGDVIVLRSQRYEVYSVEHMLTDNSSLRSYIEVYVDPIN